MAVSFILAFPWIWGLEKLWRTPTRLEWECFEGLSDACLSVISIHNHSDLTEQKMPFMLSGSQGVFFFFKIF